MTPDQEVERNAQGLAMLRGLREQVQGLVRRAEHLRDATLEVVGHIGACQTAMVVPGGLETLIGYAMTDAVARLKELEDEFSTYLPNDSARVVTVIEESGESEIEMARRQAGRRPTDPNDPTRTVKPSRVRTGDIIPRDRP